MSDQVAQSHLYLARVADLLVIEIGGCFVVGFVLLQMGYEAEWAVLAAALLNLWTSWYLFKAARCQNRRLAIIYGLFSVLGPMAALAVFSWLRLYGSLGVIALLKARFSK